MPPNLKRARELWRTNLGESPLDSALLAALFGLTPAEQRVAVLLAQGRDAAEIAALLQVQANTARSHIKQLLAKSGTRRQAEFVARVWSISSQLATSRLSHEHGSRTPPASKGGIAPNAPDLTHLGKDRLTVLTETPLHD